MEFKNIKFGRHAAEIEAAENPELIDKAYYESMGWINSAINGNEFLFLGQKGSGKSAIAQKILFSKNHELFPIFSDLNNFPFSDFLPHKTALDQSHDQNAFENWSLLILIYFCFSFINDNGRIHDPEYDALIEGITKFGFKNTLDFDGLFRNLKSKKTVFHGPSISVDNIIGLPLSITSFGIESKQDGPTTEIPVQKLINHIKTILIRQKSHSKHIMMFDGLDRALLSEKPALKSIAILISATSKMNQEFRAQNSPFKILIFCRTELFDRLDVYNANSIRQEYSIELVWHADRRHFERSHLVALANYRASIQRGQQVDIFREYFSDKIKIGNKDYIPSVFISYHTRHTPRDFISALAFIQKSIPTSINRKIEPQEIINGLTEYSRTYFVNEIRDELRGYHTAEQVDLIFQSLINLFNYRFRFDHYSRYVNRYGIKEDLALEFLKSLFACSAIGNLFQAGDGDWRPISRHYTPTAGFNPDADIIVHRGLWKAFNYV